MPGFIESEVVRTSRGMMKVNGVLLAIVLAIFAVASHYWMNFFRGPVSVTPEAVGALDAVPGRNFVKLTVHELRPTGYREITTTKRNGRTVSERPTARYYLADAGEKMILVKKPIDDTSLTMEGILEPASGQMDEVEGNIRQEGLKGAGALTPFVLDATNYRKAGYVGLCFLLPLGTLAAWNLVKARGRLADKTVHPGYRALEKFGGIARNTEQAIDAEVAAGQGVVRWKFAVLTPSWIISTFVTGFRVAKLSDIVWLYKQTGKATFAVLMLKDGTQLALSGPVDQVLQEVGARTPWAAKGWSPELAKQWKDNRAIFVEAVTKRQTSSSS